MITKILNKQNLTVIIFCLTGIIPIRIFAETQIDKQLSDYVSKAYPDCACEIAETVKGDLVGDDLSETAVFISLDEGNQSKILILKGVRSEKIVPIAISKSFENCQHGNEISIDKKTLVISCFHNGDGSIDSFDEVKYAFRKGRLRLIGKDSALVNGASFTPELSRHDINESTNYLTGNVITTKKWQTGKTTHAVSKLTQKQMIPRYFEDFDSFYD